MFKHQDGFVYLTFLGLSELLTVLENLFLSEVGVDNTAVSLYRGLHQTLKQHRTCYIHLPPTNLAFLKLSMQTFFTINLPLLNSLFY